MKAFLGWMRQNRGLVIGICAGVLTAVLFLTIGFWATLLVGVCIGGGAFLGTHSWIWGALADKIAALMGKR